MLTDFEYGLFTPEERTHLLLAAMVRQDSTEVDRLVATTKRVTYDGPDIAVTHNLRQISVMCSTALLMLEGLVQTANRLADFLAPSPHWPLDPEDAEYPRPTLAAQFVGSATMAGSSDPADWEGFDPMQVERYGRFAERAVDHFLSLFLVGTYRRARTTLAGLAGWAEALGLNSEDFMAYACEPLLDQLEELRPAVEGAAVLLRSRQQEIVEVIEGATDPDSFGPEDIDPEEVARVTEWLVEMNQKLELKPIQSDSGKRSRP